MWEHALGIRLCQCVPVGVCYSGSERDGTRAETRFGLSAKRTSPFKSAGVSVQLTAGSRDARVSGQRAYYLQQVRRSQLENVATGQEEAGGEGSL